jgi:hypothetical protein
LILDNQPSSYLFDFFFFNKALNLALRERGFFFISASKGIRGFGVNISKSLDFKQADLNKFFTTRSSPE